MGLATLLPDAVLPVGMGLATPLPAMMPERDASLERADAILRSTREMRILPAWL